MNSKIKKNLLLTIASAAACFALGGVVISTPKTVAHAATENTSLSNAITMLNGASVRIIDGNEGQNGLRFTAEISAADYAAIENDTTSYGMLIMPYDYVEKYGELTYENVFGANAKYDWAVDGEYSGTKTRIINITYDALTQDAKTGNYPIKGSIQKVQEFNLTRDFVARAYIKSGDSYAMASYFGGAIDNNVRSIYEVADAAVKDTSAEAVSDANKTLLTNSYINKATYKVDMPSSTSAYACPEDFRVKVGETAKFSVVSKTGEPLIVTANGTTLTPDENGEYSVEVTQNTQIRIYGLADQLLLKENWQYSENFPVSADDSLTVANVNTTWIQAAYVQKLWEAGYTHLAFDVELTDDKVQNVVYTHKGEGTWDKYWQEQTVANNKTIRIDLSEFKDGETYYGIDVNVRTAGNANNQVINGLVISNPRAFKSPETLKWTKNNTNVYFAIEDGYYVLQTIGGGMSVSSPTEWLKKYCVADDASQRTFKIYGDYIAKGGNTRGIIWGWNGKAVSVTGSDTNPAWTWINGAKTGDDAYKDGDTFYLSMDNGGTARFKIMDWVSNRNGHNAALGLEYVDENTIIWSAEENYKIRLATTQDYIKAGYTKLTVTFKGDLGNALIWYGEDDWSDGEVAVGADKFVNGEYTFEVDLTTFKETENFTLMGSEAAFSDIEISWTFIKGLNVTIPTGEGYTVEGASTANSGDDYTFKVNLAEGYNQSNPVVKVNGVQVFEKDGVYTVENVQEDLTITVDGVEKNGYVVTVPKNDAYVVEDGEYAKKASDGENVSFTILPANTDNALIVKNGDTVINGVNNVYTVTVTGTVTLSVEVIPVEKLLLTASAWSNGGTATADSITVAANSQIKADYLKSLWNAGYTHLVFTVNGESMTNYTHGGDWERYWRGLSAGDNVIRIDLNEFHDGETWYNINFSAGEMTVSNVKAYKSAETLAWTKIGAGKPSNVYFAIEDGYYVLETITAQGVTSPTEWLKKYVVADDASQRSWLVYTDYINKGSNTRSALWGWGSAVDVISGNADGGWTWKNGMQTDGYTDGEVFSLHTDVGGTARFKIMDWVSNRNGHNADLGLEYVNENTIIWSGADSYKLRLATTQDYIAAGYTTLQVTFKGNLGSAIIWYGNDNWSTGELNVTQNNFVDGVATIELDLTATSGETFLNGENFTLMGNAANFSDIEISWKFIKKHKITLSEGEGYTLSASTTLVDPEVGGDVTLTLAKAEGYENATPIVTANGEIITPDEKGNYVLKNVQSDVDVYVAGMAKNRYTVTVPQREGYFVTGGYSQEVAYGGSASFAISPSNREDSIVVTYNGEVIEKKDNVYTVNGITANGVFAVEVIPFVNELLSASAWTTVPASSATEDSFTINNVQYTAIDSSFLQKAWNYGYTHLAFDVNISSEATNVCYTHSGTWDKYWEEFGIAKKQTVRLDLNEFVGDGASARPNFKFREYSTGDLKEVTVSSFTISNPRLFKSAETLKWTKEGGATNVYFAIEDGYYVLQGAGGYKGVTSPTEWLKKYCVVDDAQQRSFVVYTDYLSVGGNNRGLLWGLGTPVDALRADTTGGWSIGAFKTSAYTEGDVFSLHLEAGGTARFKIMDWVSNRNGYNAAQKIEYVNENTIKWSAEENYKIRLATTQDYIAAGYTTLQVTLKGDLGSANIWYGNGSGNEIGLSAGNFTDGVCTVELDLTATSGETFLNGEPLTLMISNGNVTNMQISWEFLDQVIPATTTQYSIIVEEEEQMAAARILEEHLNETGNTYEVIWASDIPESNLGFYQCIRLGANPYGRNFQSLALGEEYYVDGDGEVIYIDGNSALAIAYGAYDLLREYGFEFYTADLMVAPTERVTLGNIAFGGKADFAMRQYIAADTAFVEAGGVSEEMQAARQQFAIASKFNNGGYVDYQGLNVKVVGYGDPSHNFSTTFDDHTEGKYGTTVKTGVGSNTGFAPCLTNGIGGTYNSQSSATDNTLTYAVARMTALMKANPNAIYFGFGHDDGPTWYCTCTNCAASDEKYGASGTLIRFINAMITEIRKDAALAEREFNIITLAYGFTLDAPKGDVKPVKSLCIQCAPMGNFDYKYPINSDKQVSGVYANGKNGREILEAWVNTISGTDATLALYLYDTSYNNYLSYFPSTTINGALDGTLAAAKEMGVNNMFVLGAYLDNNNNWQAAMKAYIWGKKLWNSSLDTATLQNEFIDAYFGPAAEQVKNYIKTYDAAYAGCTDAGWYVSSGSGYTNGLSIKQHVAALKIALAAVEAAEAYTGANKETYVRHAYAVLASTYAPILYNYDEYLGDCHIFSGMYDYRDDYLGGNKETFTQMLKDACAKAGITRVCEQYATVDEWLNNNVANNAM